MLICMRTTLNLDDNLFREAKQYAAANGRTLTSVVEEGLRAALRTHTSAQHDPIRLPTFGGDGAAAGVDLADHETLKDVLAAEEDARYRSGEHGAAS